MRITYGDVVIADLSPVVGSEQGGNRPCVVVQNDVGNVYSTTTIVVPITSVYSKSVDVVHCRIEKSEMNHLVKDGIILCEQIRSISKQRINKKIGKLTKDELREVIKKIRICIPEV